MRVTTNAPLLVGTGQNRACSVGESVQAWPSAAVGMLIHSCVNNNTGALRIITSTATPGGTGQNRACGSSETQLTWPSV